LGYRRQDSLLSRGELAFYRALVSAAADRFVVMVKVRLADLVEVERSGAGAIAALNRVSAKHVDFVLCDPGEIAPVLVIELDDSSHDSAKRRDSDAVKDRALASAGLPLVRVRAAARYDVAEIRRAVEARLTGEGRGRGASLAAAKAEHS